MRIALITSSFLPSVGGVEWKVHYLATEYTRRGHEAIVFASRPYGMFRHIPMPVETSYRIVRCGITFRGMGRLQLTDWLFAHAVMREHRRQEIDILHCHHLGAPSEWGLRVKRKTGIPVVVTTCGADVTVDPAFGYGDRLEPRFDRMIRRNAREVDVIGSISRVIRAGLAEMGATARIVDLPNGVSWDEFQCPRSTLLRDRLGLDPDSVIILSVGRNLNSKRYDLGVRALALVAGRFKQAVYVIVGRETGPLMSLADSLGVADRLKLIPEMPLPELPKVFRGADIFFNPSAREGFAQVNAQALASGLPCVITDAPGNVDAGDYGGALIAQTDDATSMAEAIAQLLADPEKRRQLGDQAHAAGKRFAWSRIAEEYLRVFEELAASRR